MPRYRRRIRWNRIFAAVLVAILAGSAVWLIRDSLGAIFPSAAEESFATEESSSASAAEADASGNASASENSAEDSLESSAESSVPERELPAGYQWLRIEESALYTGDLILVNNSIPFQAEPPETAVVYEEKTDSYKVKDMTVVLQSKVIEALNTMLGDFYARTGLDDVMVISGWRDPDKQETLYDEDLLETGKTDSTLVAKPGYSEHHTGLTLDFGLLPKSDGYGRSYDGEGEYAWINENCGSYGFILRYPADKTETTGIEYEPWHFRYVGAPHAQYIMENGLCLEEYIELLQEYPVDGTHLSTGGYSICWQLPEETADGLRIAVPAEGEYTISGDNTGGIILTIKE